MSSSTFMVTVHAEAPEHFKEQWKNSQLNFLELMKEGRLEHMHVATCWSKAWIIIFAENQQEAMDLLKVLPIHSSSVIFEFDLLIGE